MTFILQIGFSSSTFHIQIALIKLILFQDNWIWSRNGKTITCWIFGGNGRRKVKGGTDFLIKAIHQAIKGNPNFKIIGGKQGEKADVGKNCTWNNHR